MGDKK